MFCSFVNLRAHLGFYNPGAIPQRPAPLLLQAEQLRQCGTLRWCTDKMVWLGWRYSNTFPP